MAETIHLSTKRTASIDGAPLNEKMAIFADLCEDAFYTSIVGEDGISKIDWTSPAFEQITSYTKQAINEAGGLLHFADEADKQKAESQLQSAIAGRSEKCILHLHRNDQRLAKISHHIHPERASEDGPVIRLYGVIRRMDDDESVSKLNEERFSALVRAIPDSIAITNAEGLCTYYHPGRPESLYLPAEHMAGLNLTSSFPPEIVTMAADALNISAAQNQAERIEFSVEFSNQTHWYESSIAPFGDSGLMSISRNVTERKQAEEALRLSEERNRALLQAIPDMMFLIDKDGYYLDVHSNDPDDLIASDSSHIGKHTYDVVPPELAHRFLAANERVLKNSQMEMIEYELEFAEGPKIFEARIVPCGNDKVLSIVRNITNRKQSEAALRASEEQNRALLQAIPDLMLLLQNDGRYLAIHSVSDSDLFSSRNEMLGRNVSDYVSKIEFANFQKHVNQVLTTGEMVIQEYSHHFDAELRYYESRIVPCGSDKVLSITRNITERKQAEQQLRLQNALLQAQLDATPEGILAVDSERRWIGANQQFINLWALTDEVIEKRSSFVTLQHVATRVQDPEKFLESVEKVYLDQYSELIDEAHLNNGRIYERRSRPILDIEQNVLGRVWFYRDVTQERNAESLLRAAESEYRSLFENMPIGVYRSSPEGHQLRSNPALVRLNGYDNEAEQVANVKNIAAEWYVDPSRRDEFKRILERDGEVHQFESEVYRHKTRERIWISEDALLVRDNEGKPLYYEGTVQDITERKRAEEAIRTLNEQLQNASRLKDEFLKNISHEFRTPLTIILTLSETLSSGRFGEVSEQQKNSLRRIQKQSHNLLEMVNNLLDIATLLSGAASLHYSPVSLQDLCAHVLHSTQISANDKEIALTCTIDPNVKTIEADERRLGQIIQLLIGNAIRFTPAQGTVGVDIQGLTATQEVKIIVWDTGINIQPEDSQKLFQPFIQADTTLSRRYEGAGLGLALVAHLTEMHKGTIIVESQPGSGARFIVTLPWTSTK